MRIKQIGAVIMIALLLTGCGQRGIAHNGYARFKTVETYKDGWEVVDKDTGFSYFIFSGGGGVIPLFDEDGHLYRANGWRDYGT